jgi:hypothetical protein
MAIYWLFSGRKTSKHEKRNCEIDYHHRSECEGSLSIPPKCTLTKHLTAAWPRHKMPSLLQISSESRRLKEHESKIQTSKPCTSAF